MKYYLGKYRDCWADEINISGIKAITEKDLNLDKEYAKLYFEKFGYYEYSIGTNEEITYRTLTELMNRYSFEDITEDEYKTLRKLGVSNGFNPLERIGEDVCDRCGDEGEDVCKKCIANQ